MDSSDSPIQPPLKNSKTESEGLLEAEDRISHLPDGVICHILSFIPTKYSIRTSVLSKRWENLWAFAPKIEIELSLYSDKEAPDRPMKLCSTFTHSVDNLFSSRGSMPIDTFKLHFNNGSAVPPRWRPSLWICAVIRCNVRELDLEIGYTESDFGALPCCLFTCSNLVVLKLSGRFVLNVPYHACLPNLKSLFLDTIIYLDDASFQKFLSGCPTLEDLEIIIRDWDPVVLNIGLSSLKRLSLYSDRVDDRTERSDDDQYKIVVDAPNLEFIDLENWSDDVFLKFLPNILEARVDICAMQNRFKVIKLLRSMVNVTRLFLSSLTLESLGFSIRRALPTFCNLIQLELDYDSEYGPVRLMDLLCSSPKLEALSLPAGIYYYGDDSDTDFEFPDHFPEQVPECLHRSLKTVQIQYFHGEPVELNIVEYLLENSMVLEKMTLLCTHKPSSVEFVELKAKLANCEKLSTDCQLDLLYQYEKLSTETSADSSTETSADSSTETSSETAVPVAG